MGGVKVFFDTGGFITKLQTHNNVKQQTTNSLSCIQESSRRKAERKQNDATDRSEGFRPHRGNLNQEAIDDLAKVRRLVRPDERGSIKRGRQQNTHLHELSFLEGRKMQKSK